VFPEHNILKHCVNSDVKIALLNENHRIFVTTLWQHSVMVKQRLPGSTNPLAVFN